MTELRRRDAVRLLSAGAVLLAAGPLVAGCSSEDPSPSPPQPGRPAPGSPFPGAADLGRALDEIDRGKKVEFGLGVVDARSGHAYVHDPIGSHEMASAVKVDLLVGLLMRAERAGRDLNPVEKSRAATMIRVSDNAAAEALWAANGRAAGMSAIWRSLGLSSLQPGRSGRWGLSRTSIDDRLRLLDVLAGGSPGLSGERAGYALQLMTEVTGSQRWGVGTVARRGEVVAVKNGWLPRPGGGWIVSSTGRLHGPSSDLRMAVLSRGHPTEAVGITFVEAVLAAARQHLDI